MSSKPTAPTRTSDPGVVAIVIRQLSERFGSRLSTGASVREQHGRGESLDPGMPPDAVVWPESTEEICEIVRTCAAAGVPIIPFGAGTSLEGHVSAPFGGICVDLSRMDKILAVNAEDMDCVVQPGVTREDLNAYLRETGLYFPVDPGANASIGGMVSTRASGTTTVMYGAMTHNVLALEVVLADGRVMRCGTRARKSSAGYDLVRLLTGAEGTLGIISRDHAAPARLPGGNRRRRPAHFRRCAARSTRSRSSCSSARRWRASNSSTKCRSAPATRTRS